MANEATVFSLTTTEMAAGNVTSEAGGKAVDIATANADVVPGSIDIGLYFLKAAYEGAGGRSLLMRHIDKLRAKVAEAAWPPI